MVDLSDDEEESLEPETDIFVVNYRRRSLRMRLSPSPLRSRR